MLALAAYYVVPQLGQLPRIAGVLHDVDPGWLAVASVASVMTFLASTICAIGSAGGPLPVRATLAAELAGTALNRLTPAGLGRAAVLARYYERTGRSRAQAATATAINVTAGAVVHTLALSVGGVLLVRSSHLAITHREIVRVELLAAVLAVGLAIALTRRASRWQQPLADAANQLLLVLRRPRSAAALFGGALGLNAAFVLALCAALLSVGVHHGLAATAVVYLAASAGANVSPLPGGLGVMEVALVAGLTRTGVAPAPAVAGVLVYRLLTYWLPVLPGLWSLRHLRRRGLL